MWSLYPSDELTAICICFFGPALCLDQRHSCLHLSRGPARRCCFYSPCFLSFLGIPESRYCPAIDDPDSPCAHDSSAAGLTGRVESRKRPHQQREPTGQQRTKAGSETPQSLLRTLLLATTTGFSHHRMADKTLISSEKHFCCRETERAIL